MQNYNSLIDKELPGESPKAKFDSLMLMKKFLSMVAYPRRGIEENMVLQDIADSIQVCFTVEDLEVSE